MSCESIDSSLRKVGYYEDFNLNECGCTLMTRYYRIKSKINLFDHLDIVKQSIHEWKIIHPFLRCQVSKTLNEKNECLNKYFYLKEKDYKEICVLNNVDYIVVNIDDENNADCLNNKKNDIINLLVERDLSMTINLDRELLWKLTFIKFDDTNSSKSIDSSFEYSFDALFTIHHEIMEGRCTYRIFLQLLNIIEQHITNTYKRMETTDLLPTIEDVFYNKFKQIKRNDENLEKFKMASFVDIEKSILDSYRDPQFLNQNDWENMQFKSLKNNQYVFSLKDLITISKKNNSKFRFVCFDSNVNIQLIKMCKQKNVKFYGLLNVILNMAFKKLYNKYGSNNEIDKQHDIYYVNTVSLRCNLDEFVELHGQDCNEIMGYFVNFMLNKSHIEIDKINDPTSFWNFVKTETDNFQSRLKNNEHLSEPKWAKNLKYNEQNCDYWLANLGVLPYSYKENGLFEINDSFFASKCCREFKDRFVLNNFVTINNKLYWSISFNSYFTDQFFIDDYINYVKEIVKMIIDN